MIILAAASHTNLTHGGLNSYICVLEYKVQGQMVLIAKKCFQNVLLRLPLSTGHPVCGMTTGFQRLESLSRASGSAGQIVAWEQR